MTNKASRLYAAVETIQQRFSDQTSPILFRKALISVEEWAALYNAVYEMKDGKRVEVFSDE